MRGLWRRASGARALPGGGALQGLGFYSTDYGKGGRKPSRDGEKADSGSDKGEKKEKPDKDVKKVAES